MVVSAFCDGVDSPCRLQSVSNGFGGRGGRTACDKKTRNVNVGVACRFQRDLVIRAQRLGECGEVVELIPSEEREGAIQTEMPRSRDLCPTPSVRAGQYSPRSTAPLVPE